MDKGPTMAALTPDQVADQLIRRRVVELAAAALPELDMPEVKYEVRSSGTGFWQATTPQAWLLSRSNGRQVRVLADYDAAHRVVLLFGGDA